MKQFKLQKNFWDAYVNGTKKYEFRKLGKGITTGKYEFVSVEGGGYYCDKCKLWGKGFNCYNWEWKPKEKFGTVHLKPIGINLQLTKVENDYWVSIDKGSFYQGETIDKDTYDFVKTNYIDKGIDFVVYEISDVKENK